jgi:hypothetical protein
MTWPTFIKMIEEWDKRASYSGRVEYSLERFKYWAGYGSWPTPNALFKVCSTCLDDVAAGYGMTVEAFQQLLDTEDEE